MAEDLYSTLGVNKSASADEIKKAYRKAAKQHHPDVNPGDKKAEDQFKKISSAFEVLSDPKKRKLYDEFGEDAQKLGFDEKKAEAYRAYRSGGMGGMGGGIPYGAQGVDLGDLFGEIFGAAARGRGGARGARVGGIPFDVEGFGGFGGAASGEPEVARGEDLSAKVLLTLRDAAGGTERSLVITRPGRCATCTGSGTSGAVSGCAMCGGAGRARSPLGQRICPTCMGTGKAAKPCPSCGGDGRVSETQRVTVKIPAGVRTGSKVRVAGQGAAGVRGGAPGDLFIETEIEEHPLLRREDDDLYLNVPITVPEALLGGEVRVPTFAGEVTVTLPPHSQSGRKMRLRGKGIPHLKGGGTGDLYLVLEVMVPDGDAPSIREAAEQLKAGYLSDVRAELKL